MAGVYCRMSLRALSLFGAFAILACSHASNLPLAAAQDQSPMNTELTVYQAFVQEHCAWAGGCLKAVLDMQPLPAIDVADPHKFFQEPRPSLELINQYRKAQKSLAPFLAAQNSFFVATAHSGLKDIFPEPCLLQDAKAHKCGWLRFKDAYGNACGVWQFSHIGFNQDQNEAMFQYQLSIYHWGESGWTFLRLQDGHWKLMSVGVTSVT
jgi:hypothetical protein